MDGVLLRAAAAATVVLITLHQHTGAAIKCYSCISTIQPQCRLKYAADHFILVKAPTDDSVCYMSRQKATSGNLTMYTITRGFLYSLAEAKKKCAAVELEDASNLCQYCASGDGCNWKTNITLSTPPPSTAPAFHHSGAPAAVTAISAIALPILAVLA